MKHLFTCIFFLLLTSSAFCQKILFSQNFDFLPTYTITGWNTATYSGIVPWQAGLLYNVGGTCLGGPHYERVAAICNCPTLGTKDSSNKPNYNVFMYTPKIDLSGVQGAWVKFDSYFNRAWMGSDTEKATIEISTNGGVNWTVLLDVQANKLITLPEAWHIDLSGYDNAADIRIGFRYNDAGLNIGGWAVDNVQVYVPVKKDMALLAVTPDDTLLRYTELGSTLTYGGEVYNAGLDTITEYIIHYQQDGKAIKSDTTTGVVIPSFTSHSFTHKVPDTAFGAKAAVKIWVETAGDTVYKNNSKDIDIRGAHFMPVKRPIVEEGTGTWHPDGPLGWVYMNRLFDTLWADISLVSIHSGDSDPMKLDVYDDYIFNLNWNYVPYMLLDRRTKVNPDSLFYLVKRQRDYFGFASVDFTYKLTGDELVVTTHIKPAIDMEGDFRIALVITENDVRGTDDKWRQKNKYAGGKWGPMGGFENKPEWVPASEMYYNFVARDVSPGPEGKKGLLPAKLVHNTEYVNSISTQLKPEWNKEQIKFIVLLMRANDTTILNSNEVLFAINVPTIEEPLSDAVIYPNPASNIIRAAFRAGKSETVNCRITDIGGRCLFTKILHTNSGVNNVVNIPVEALQNGLYFMTLESEGFSRTFKFNVVH